MTPARRLLLAGLACWAVALPLGVASWVAQGPLPGDVGVTKALQSAFGAEPEWAEFLTGTAKPPLVWFTLIVGAALAWAKAGWRGAIAVPIAFLIVYLTDKGLRASIYVPKPIAEYVPIAKFSESSGLPSTFGLVFGAAFGAAALLPRVVRSRWGVPPRGLSLAATVIAGALLVAGACCRTVLGGHWFSQMAASLTFAFGVTLLIGWVVWAWRPPVPVPATPATPEAEQPAAS
ncbi:hypothetical protein [Alienimonas chondri]|uniref:Phosphatase PAP2 family protein n=1 Tax=Alienimonas chondri TaxID=2681879 RepID=A0ABX1VEC2_9PLAN|nr:hypothetical protein [Alienimonas chondri]NNJ25637.1 hypothetical protein [Alienimonas chondri]